MCAYYAFFNASKKSTTSLRKPYPHGMQNSPCANFSCQIIRAFDCLNTCLQMASVSSNRSFDSSTMSESTGKSSAHKL